MTSVQELGDRSGDSFTTDIHSIHRNFKGLLGTIYSIPLKGQP